MSVLRTVVWALLVAALATGCAGDDEHTGPRSLPEQPREETRALLRQIAADVVREQFGALPAPVSEKERRCDSGRWYDDEDAYLLTGTWELPLAPEDHERVMRALSTGGSGLVNTGLWDDGQGGSWVGGQHESERAWYSVRSGDTPGTVRVQVGSHCLLDRG